MAMTLRDIVFYVAGASILYAVVLVCLPGCHRESSVSQDIDWMPPKVFPVDIRPLPPSILVGDAFAKWSHEQVEVKSLYYIALLSDSSRQTNYKVRFASKETPVGTWLHTEVSFTYNDPTNGEYIMEWDLRGKHDPKYLKLTDSPRRFLLKPISRQDIHPPTLKILGVEGVPCRHGAMGQ